MLFKHFGDKKNPSVILLHGGGVSWWMWQRHIAQLYKDYYVITPIIDGHDIDGNEFLSISDSAENLITFIDTALSGKVYALCGFSLGAQVALDVLAKRADIATYALIESALTEPTGLSQNLIASMVNLSYGLISKRWFAKAQAKQLFISDECFETYFKSSQKISKTSLVNITSANSDFRCQPALKQCTAQVLILAGEKELKAVLTSASQLNRLLPHSEIKLLKNYKHGELSLDNPFAYTDIFRKWIEK